MRIEEAGSDISIREEVRAAIASSSKEKLFQLVKEHSVDDQRRVIDQLSHDEHAKLLLLLPPEETTKLIEHLAEVQSVEILEEIPPTLAAEVVNDLPVDLSSNLLRELDKESKEEILTELEKTTDCTELRQRVSYEKDTAGDLMTEHVASFNENMTIREVLVSIGKSRDEYTDTEVQYFFITNDRGVLTGVLSLRNLVLGERTASIKSIMIPEPLAASLKASLEDLEDLFESKNYLGLPVIDDSGKLMGLVARTDFEEAISQRQTDDYLKASGIIGGEELRSMSLMTRSKNRLLWLIPNIFLNLVAAIVIAGFEETLQAVIILAVFLPMVSDMSACSGNQAVAVSIRELTLGIIRPLDYMRVLWKEFLVGLPNGIVLGVLLGVIAAVWKSNVYLGVVIGSALMINIVLSVLIGGLVPLLLKKVNADPALASGPVLTFFTDLLGFILVLSFASMMISQLV